LGLEDARLRAAATVTIRDAGKDPRCTRRGGGIDRERGERAADKSSRGTELRPGLS
jgi:hypothetical protein